ncbi:MAG: DUF5652 family protein [Nanoarchaeota archaeon]|nr:DUF5652 family protein [Nanoarchaeota archaeon]
MVAFTVSTSLILLLVIVGLWDSAWKIVGAWRAGRNNQLGWFVAILIFNTVGILPLIYLVWFERKREVKGKRILKSFKKRR